MNWQGQEVSSCVEILEAGARPSRCMVYAHVTLSSETWIQYHDMKRSLL